MNEIEIFLRSNKIGLGKNIEIDENRVEEEEITEETTEPVAENNFRVAVAPDLTTREEKNRHPPIMILVKAYLKRIRKYGIFYDFRSGEF